MDIRLILFGMCFILLGLFLWAKFFVPKEKNNSQKEGNYALAVLNFRKNPNQENFLVCFQAAKQIPQLHNLKEDEVKAFLKKDQVFIA